MPITGKVLFLLACFIRTSTHLQTLSGNVNCFQTRLVPVRALLALCAQTVHKQIFLVSCLPLEMENKIQFANMLSANPRKCCGKNVIVLLTFPWSFTSVIQLASIIRLFNNKIFFYGVEVVSFTLQPPTWRTRVTLFLWIIWPHKPHHYNRVEIPSGRAKYVSITVNQRDRGLAAPYFVSVHDILQPIICSNISRLKGVILTKFLKPAHSLSFKSPKRFLHTTFLHWSSLPSSPVSSWVPFI